MAPKVQGLVVVEKIDLVNMMYKLPPSKDAKIDKMGALSLIPPRVILIKDICAFIFCKIKEIYQFEIATFYQNICVNGKLKDEHIHLETKGLVHDMHVPSVFKTQWMRIVLS